MYGRMVVAERVSGNRERLIDAARGLFLEHGYAETGVRAIAARAGCNVSLIKHYFGSKDGLLRAIVIEGIGVIGGEVRAILSEPSPPEERLLRLIDFLVDHVTDHLALFQIVHREMECLGNVAPELLPRIASLHEQLVGVLSELRDQGRLRDVEPVVAATLLLAMIRFPFMAQPLSTRVLGPLTHERIETIKRQVASVFLHGVLTGDEA